MYPDVWLGTPFSWVVHVNQPWWRATGVYIIIVVLILSLLLVNFIIYSRNMRMRTKRNAEEGDIMKKLNSFVDRCNAINAEELTQNADDLYGDRLNTGTSLSSDFVELMLRLMPYIQANNGQVSLHQLSKVGKIDIVPLYEILSANLYKSPRGLSRMYRLRRAAKLLRTTQKSVEEIATECGFYTPNYFMGNFFHEYKLTPREYREEHSGEA
jgi:AraC-like DNA-binding protein